jgi:integrase
VLFGIFKRAVVSGFAARNPVEAIRGRLGREDREVRQVEWLSEAELHRLLAEAERREPRAYPLLLTLASAGLRIGEVLGLRVGDLDLERGKLYVRRAVRKYRVGSPKSGKPRTVDVPPATVAVLRGWLDVVRAEAAVRGQEPLWVFPSASGRLQDDWLVREALRRVLQAAGIRRRVRPHDLRHTYAALALQRGVPLLTVSRQLGHASIKTTGDIYGHLASEAGREAAAAWEAILTAPGRNPGATVAAAPA